MVLFQGSEIAASIWVSHGYVNCDCRLYGKGLEGLMES